LSPVALFDQTRDALAIATPQPDLTERPRDDAHHVVQKRVALDLDDDPIATVPGCGRVVGVLGGMLGELDAPRVGGRPQRGGSSMHGHPRDRANRGLGLAVRRAEGREVVASHERPGGVDHRIDVESATEMPLVARNRIATACRSDDVAITLAVIAAPHVGNPVLIPGRQDGDVRRQPPRQRLEHAPRRDRTGWLERRKLPVGVHPRVGS